MTAMSDDNDDDNDNDDNDDDAYNDGGRRQWQRLPTPVPINGVL